jgi:hypothetical protein
MAGVFGPISITRIANCIHDGNDYGAFAVQQPAHADSLQLPDLVSVAPLITLVLCAVRKYDIPKE